VLFNDTLVALLSRQSPTVEAPDLFQDVPDPALYRRFHPDTNQAADNHSADNLATLAVSYQYVANDH
jgi:hypothetical protein